MEVSTIRPSHSTSRGCPTLSDTTFMRPSSCEQPSLFGLSRPEMQEIRDDLRILQGRAEPERLVGGARLRQPFQPEARVDQQIEPLAERPRESGSLELRQPDL